MIKEVRAPLKAVRISIPKYISNTRHSPGKTAMPRLCCQFGKRQTARQLLPRWHSTLSVVVPSHRLRWGKKTPLKCQINWWGRGSLNITSCCTMLDFLREPHSTLLCREPNLSHFTAQSYMWLEGFPPWKAAISKKVKEVQCSQIRNLSGWSEGERAGF